MIPPHLFQMLFRTSMAACMFLLIVPALAKKSSMAHLGASPLFGSVGIFASYRYAFTHAARSKRFCESVWRISICSCTSATNVGFLTSHPTKSFSIIFSFLSYPNYVGLERQGVEPCSCWYSCKSFQQSKPYHAPSQRKDSDPRQTVYNSVALPLDHAGFFVFQSFRK